MKKIYLFIFIFSFLYITNTFSQSIIEQQIPFGLTVDGVRDPEYIVIQNRIPEFGWIVPQSAKNQKAYRILVASSLSNIDKNVGDVWDSKQVISSKSTNVKCLGDSLHPNENYFWKVCLWGQDSLLCDYSQVQKFKTGPFTGELSLGNHFQVEMIKPKLIRSTSANSYFVDFGKDAFGTLILRYNSKNVDTLKIRLGEKLSGQCIDKEPGGTIRYQEFKLGVSAGDKTYLIKLTSDSGTGVILPDSFDVVTPFRYCEIDNYNAELTLNDISQKAFFNYFADSASSFTSSDTILNKVWDLCKYSIKATSFSGVYIDGDRERKPYEADAYINQLGHYCSDREYAMARRTIEWFMTKPTWPTEWSLHTALMMKEDYYYTGNLDLIRLYYDKLMLKTLIQLAREDGLISLESPGNTAEFKLKLGVNLADIVDWPTSERDDYDMESVNTVVNCFFYKNMEIMSEFADLLNKQADKDMFLSMAAKVKETINLKLFNKVTGIYIDGEGSEHSSLHANMFALAFGIVSKENENTVVNFIKSCRMACSVYGAQYLMEALYMAGEQQFALDLLRSTDTRGWYNMIRVGSTITMEAWDMKYKPNSDWNHAWGAAPANIIPRKMWGITPKTPGFDVVSVKPQLGNLTSTSILLPSIRGNIKCSFNQNSDQSQIYTVELPSNSRGEFIGDFLVNHVVSLNGKTVDNTLKTLQLESGVNVIKCVKANPSNTCVVSFVMNDGTTISSIIAAKNTLIIEPATPLRYGYVFQGWYKDLSFLNSWNFAEDTVKTDTNIYARWEPVTMINEQSTNSFSITPNPASTRIYLSNFPECSDIYIYSFDGKSLKQLNCFNDKYIDIHDFIAGFYLIKLVNKNYAAYKLFIKK